MNETKDKEQQAAVCIPTDRIVGADIVIEYSYEIIADCKTGEQKAARVEAIAIAINAAIETVGGLRGVKAKAIRLEETYCSNCGEQLLVWDSHIYPNGYCANCGADIVEKGA